MPETETIRIYKKDKERIKEMADAKNQKVADVFAHIVREPVHLCPECGEEFVADEIDPETVRYHGPFETGLDNLIVGERTVKDFECPSCSERVRPKDMESSEAGTFSSATAEDIGVTPEASEGGSSSKGA